MAAAPHYGALPDAPASADYPPASADYPPSAPGQPVPQLATGGGSGGIISDASVSLWRISVSQAPPDELALTPTPNPDPNPNPNQASALSKMSHQFHRGARAARRIQMWQQARK